MGGTRGSDPPDGQISRGIGAGGPGTHTPSLCETAAAHCGWTERWDVPLPLRISLLLIFRSMIFFGISWRVHPGSIPCGLSITPSLFDLGTGATNTQEPSSSAPPVSLSSHNLGTLRRDSTTRGRDFLVDPSGNAPMDGYCRRGAPPLWG